MPKITKKKIKKVSKSKAKPVKKSKETVKKIKTVKSKPVKVTLKQKELDTKANRLIAKGKERGFITYDEILKEFPKVEDDVIFLDDLYNKLVVAGIDVLEGGGMLEVDDEQLKKYSLMEVAHQMPVMILSRFI